MKDRSKDLLKIVIVMVILMVLSGGIIYLRIKRSLPSKTETGQKSVTTTSGSNQGIQANSLFLVVSPQSAQVDADINTAVAFYAPGKILSGTDIILTFDPSFLSSPNVTDLKTGEYFASYPAKSVDNEKGIIRLTAFGGGKEPASSPEVIFSVNLKAKKAGKTEIKLDYQPGSTNRSTLVEKGTSKNILTGVTNAEVEIK